jgi:3-oxoacyl-[acyl-carrier protein] reductase
MPSVEGPVAIVTGAGGVIGRATARRLAADGVAVAVVDVDAERARETTSNLSSGGATALAVAADVTDPADVIQLVERVVERLGRLDVLVNNAGINRPGPLLELTLDQFDAVIDVSLRGAFLCSQAVARHLRDAGRPGVIVNMASAAAYRGVRGRGNHVIAKAGVVALTRVLAVELAAHRIRVNAIAPGFVRPDGAGAEAGRGLAGPQELAEAAPVGRLADPDEVAGVISFLAGPDASFMTGETVVVDGGLLVRAHWDQPT